MATEAMMASAFGLEIVESMYREDVVLANFRSPVFGSIILVCLLCFVFLVFCFLEFFCLY